MGRRKKEMSSKGRYLSSKKCRERSKKYRDKNDCISLILPRGTIERINEIDIPRKELFKTLMKNYIEKQSSVTLSHNK